MGIKTSPDHDVIDAELQVLISEALPIMTDCDGRSCIRPPEVPSRRPDTTASSRRPQYKRVHSLLLCGICYERFQLPQRAPKVLPCQHSFCVRCVSCLVAEDESLRCPMCRKSHLLPADGVGGLPTNLTIISLLDCYCTLCQNDEDLEQCTHCDKPICHDCKELHAEQMTEHALKKLQQLSADRDVLQGFYNNVGKAVATIGAFVDSKKATATSTSVAASADVTSRGLCRLLDDEIARTSPLLETSKGLLDRIDAVIRGDFQDCDCDCLRSLRRCEDDQCDGGCLSDGETDGSCCGDSRLSSTSSQCVAGCCDTPAAIKELNKHSKDVSTVTSALEARTSVLSKYTECYMKRQVKYLRALDERFTNPHDGHESATIITTSFGHDFVRPSHVALCKTSGCFYVLDQGDNTLSRIDPDCPDEVTRLSIYSAANGQTQFSGLAVDGEGNVLVSDSSGDTINVYSPEGSLLRCLGSRGNKNGQLHSPMGLTCDRQGNVHVCDWGNQRMQVLTTDGQFVQSYGDAITDSDMFRPQFAHFDPTGETIFVSDTQGGLVYVFDARGQLLGSSDLGVTSEEPCVDLVWPAGVTTIRHGYALVADWSGSTLSVLGPSGLGVCQLSGPGEELGRLDCPRGVAYCVERDLLVVCDTGNHRVQLIQL